MPSGCVALTSIFCCSRERTVSRSDRITASGNRVSPPAAEARLMPDRTIPSNSFSRNFVVIMVDEVYVMCRRFCNFRYGVFVSLYAGAGSGSSGCLDMSDADTVIFDQDRGRGCTHAAI